MQRFFFTIYQSLKVRQHFKNCLIQRCVLDLNPSILQRQGVQTLILDFDGVLNSHGEDILLPPVHDWLLNCMNFCKIYILSNKPTKARQEYFAKVFPQIEFIIAAKKPYIDGILQIAERSGSIGHQLLIVDDRLLTGVLAGCLAGIQVAFIQAPWVNFTKRPLKESFFLSLRIIERIYLGFKLNDVCGYRKLH